MADHDPENLEERLAALVSGDLAPEEAREVLLLVTHDAEARQLLGEMLDLQAAARRAYGFDQAVPRMRESLAQLLGSLRSMQMPPSAMPPAPRTTHGRPTGRLLRVTACAAAALLFVAAVGLAIKGHYDGLAAQQQLARLREAKAMPEISQAELQQYRRIWSEVSDGAERARPWVTLSSGGGQFGYLPTSTGPASDVRLLLIRCVVLSAGSERVESLTLLVPARRGVPLNLPEVGRLLGRPLACEITAGDHQASVGLTVGEDSAEAVGIRGHVAFGQRSVEIGRFTLDGGPLRVVVQAVPLDGTVG
jgi:hypothetical protein